MNIDKLETDGKISKVKLLHDCAGTLRTAAALKNSLDKSAASVTKKHQALQNAQQQDLQGTNVTATLFNYQKALAAAERQAGVLYKEVQKNNNNDNGALLDSLRKTVQGYQQLHREAELLQEAFGLNNSAANIDFNDVDYFIAKLRCGAEEAGQQELFTLLFGDLPAKLQALSEIDLGGNKITPQIADKDTDAMYLLAADFLNIMSAYEKPMIHVVPEQAEGIFMASGDKTVCRFGRTEANPGADTCQACSKSGGTASKLAESTFRSDYNGCPDNMPEKP